MSEKPWKNLSDYTKMNPTWKQMTLLQGAVTKISDDMVTLERLIRENETLVNENVNLPKNTKETLLSTVKVIKEHQNDFNKTYEGFFKTETWHWYQNTWRRTQEKLTLCLTDLQKYLPDQDFNDPTVPENEPERIAFMNLITQCETCISDMENYKNLCESIPLMYSFKQETQLTSNMTSNLEALKALT